MPRQYCGNNVWAQEDRDNNNNTTTVSVLSTTVASQTCPLDYTCMTLPRCANSYRQISKMAITNLFYWNNLVHDITYLYGFDELSGNFQNSNQGRAVPEMIGVKADVQDAGGTNNANFSTPNDGSQPRMFP
ncbi:MAG: M36 family metallopeptidase [Ferruginibacter sp.]